MSPNRPSGSDGLSKFLQSRVSRRRMVLGTAGAIGAGALASLLAACGNPGGGGETPAGGGAQGTQAGTGQTPTASAGTPKKGGTLKVAIIGDPPAFDPTFTTATVTANTTWHVFEGLYSQSAKFEPIPMLLDKTEVQENGKVFVFTLRKDVKFHNGNTLTADDAVASVQRWGKLSGRGKTIFARLDTIEKVDDLNFKMSFKQATGILPVFLSQADVIIIPKDVAEAAPDKEMPQFIGTGPYKLVEKLPNRYIRLARFDNYSARDEQPNGYGGGKTAYVDEIQFIPVPEIATRADGLQTGEYHFAEQLSTDSYNNLAAIPDLEMDITKPYYWYTAHFNKSSGNMFADEKLRMAFLTAIDMDPVMRAGFGDPKFWRLGPEIAAPETAWYTDAGKEYYNQKNPDKAKQLLQEAGYDGKPVRWISTKEYTYNYNMALALKEQLEKVGVKIDLQVMTWATLVATRSQKDAWDIFITGHPSYNHPVLQVYLNSTWPGFWSDPNKDKALQDLISEPDAAKQKELIATIQGLQWSTAAQIKVGEGFPLRGYSKKLKGYTKPSDWFFWNSWLES